MLHGATLRLAGRFGLRITVSSTSPRPSHPATAAAPLPTPTAHLVAEGEAASHGRQELADHHSSRTAASRMRNLKHPGPVVGQLWSESKGWHGSIDRHHQHGWVAAKLSSPGRTLAS
jgi:hypothetical protein